MGSRAVLIFGGVAVGSLAGYAVGDTKESMLAGAVTGGLVGLGLSTLSFSPLSVTNQFERPELRMTDEVYQEIKRSIGSLVPEHGGILGGDPETDTITHYVPDTTAERSAAAYSPDVVFLNRLLKETWKPKGIRFLGFVHSHPRGIRRPSAGDHEYAVRIFQSNPHRERLYLPLVMSSADNRKFEFLPFVAQRQGTDRVTIVPGTLKRLPPQSQGRLAGGSTGRISAEFEALTVTEKAALTCVIEGNYSSKEQLIIALEGRGLAGPREIIRQLADKHIISITGNTLAIEPAILRFLKSTPPQRPKGSAIGDGNELLDD